MIVFVVVAVFVQGFVRGIMLTSNDLYTEKHSIKSASGGMATWFLETLLKSGEIDSAICVAPDPNSPSLFSFKNCRTVEEIHECAGSCYQPVEISSIIKYMLSAESKFAVVALPCMAHGLRLAMNSNSKLRSSIRYIIGLVCGGMKTRHYIEYVAKKWLKRDGNPTRIIFRHKVDGQNSTDLTFKVWFENELNPRYIKFSDGIGSHFCNGSFNLEACDYCDDIFAECADITFMDAWLKDYVDKQNAHSLVMIRAAEIQRLFSEMIKEDKLNMSPIRDERVKESQTRVHVVSNKRILNGCNSEVAHKQGMNVPQGRFLKPRIDQRIEAFIKRSLRRKTKIQWIRCKGNIEFFDRKCRNTFCQNLYYHYFVIASP